MDEFTKLVDIIQNNPKITSVRFSTAFIEDIGNILENRGFEEAKLFIWQHQKRTDLEKQIQPMLLILYEMEKIERIREDRTIGKNIIKNKLNQLMDQNKSK